MDNNDDIYLWENCEKYEKELKDKYYEDLEDSIIFKNLFHECHDKCYKDNYCENYDLKYYDPCEGYDQDAPLMFDENWEKYKKEQQEKINEDWNDAINFKDLLDNS